MKRFLTTVLGSCLLWTLASLSLSSMKQPTVAQTSPSADLYYLYQGKRLPLIEQLGIGFPVGVKRVVAVGATTLEGDR